MVNISLAGGGLRGRAPLLLGLGAVWLMACTALLGDEFVLETGSGAGSGEGGAGAAGGGVGGNGAGGASVGGAGACGDGNLDPGEACDDGNSTSDDGCFDCASEWTCSAPGQLELTTQGPILYGKVAGSTLDGSDQLGSVNCGGTPVGAATDRVFEITTPSNLDAFFRLKSAHDGLLRLSQNPCMGGNQTLCANAIDGGGDEILHAPGLPMGTYYAHVDGVAAEDAGDFELEVVACNSDRHDLVFRELHIGSQDYVMIENRGTCPVQLNNVRIFFDDRDDIQTGLEDCLTSLPKRVLVPGESIRVHETPLAGDIDALPGIMGCGSGVSFNPARGGSAYLCDGACDSAADIIDMVSFLGNSGGSVSNPPTPIAGVTFSQPLASIATNVQNSRRWVRTSFNANGPTFQGSEWTLESRSLLLTFESDTGNFVTDPGSAATIGIDIEAAVGNGSVSLEQTGGNGVSDTLSLGLLVTPRSVSFHTRASGTDFSGGYFEMRSGALVSLVSSFEATGYGLERENNERSETPFAADTWYHIEFRNIDWSARTADLYVDSKLIEQAVAFWDNPVNMTELRLYSVTSGSKVWWDEIELW